jgi:uncharacterized protein (UPF0333 family)
MGSKRGQISAEYLIVVGFVVFLVITIMGVAFFYTSTMQDRIKMSQLEGFARKVISNSETVYFAGDPSKATINAYLPSGVHKMSVQEDNYLFFEISTSSGVNEISFKSSVPLELQENWDNPGEGLKKLILTIGGNNKVLISNG